jgi:small conductance mechanosensitive channel
MPITLDQTIQDTQQRLSTLQSLLYSLAKSYGLQFVESLLVLVCGFVLTRILSRWAKLALDKREIEPPVKLLILRVVRLSLYATTLMVVMDTVGFRITAVLAGISVAGVGVGLATQGVLSNVVAGLTIIFTKPFKVGDYIELQGVSGQVTHIDLTASRLVRGDLSILILPNKHIVGEIVHNFGVIRQLDILVGVAYHTDVATATRLLRTILDQNPRVLKTPAPFVGVTALGPSSIHLEAKPWTALGDFGAAQSEIYEAIIREFRAQKIELPLPQHEVRLLNPAPETSPVAKSSRA